MTRLKECKLINSKAFVNITAHEDVVVVNFFNITTIRCTKTKIYLNCRSDKIKLREDVEKWLGEPVLDQIIDSVFSY